MKDTKIMKPSDPTLTKKISIDTSNGRNWTPSAKVILIDCAMELKKVNNLYYDADFDGNIELASFYKNKAKNLKALVDEGVEHTVNF